MDQLTHTVRRSNWINIIRQCQDRPAGTTAKQWLAENGTIMITFSMHSVVSFCSPFTVSKMPQPPMTSDKGFIQRLRFNVNVKSCALAN